MNKKQKITLVVVAVLLCAVLLIAPKKHMSPMSIDGSTYIWNDKPRKGFDGMPCSKPIILWDFVIQRSLVVIIVGVAAFLLLKSKNE